MLRRSANPACFPLPRIGAPRSPAGPPHGRAYGKRGSVIIETAFTLALFLTVLFGIVETSLAAYTYHFISHAAREGTRYAIVRGSACNSFGSACPANAGDIRAHVRGLAFPGINGTIEVDICGASFSVLPSSCAATTWPTGNDPGNLVQVTVRYPYRLSLPFMPARTINMTSTSAMVISQ